MDREFEGEPLDVALNVYRLKEIAVEKQRALLKSRQHLLGRGCLRNHPRDVYDLSYLREQSALPVNWREIGQQLPGKVETYGLACNGPEDSLDERVMQVIQRDWQAQSSVADPLHSNAAPRRYARFSGRSSVRFGGVEADSPGGPPFGRPSLTGDLAVREKSVEIRSTAGKPFATRMAVRVLETVA